MRGLQQNSKKGLSPLLAIIIGLIVTIVAGILLAQLYFSYATSISARPAANIEYIDLVVDEDGNGILVVNIKNIGNVPIHAEQEGNQEQLSVDVQLDIDGQEGDDCHETVSGSGEPGTTASAVCDLSGVEPGATYSGSVVITFDDGSSQAYPIAVRARRA